MSAEERVVVGRKTPRDGKLEVSAGLARALGGHGTEVLIRGAGSEERGVVSVLPCTCEKAGASGKHEHHFVQCDAFRQLEVGSDLQLRAEGGELEVLAGP